MRRANRRVLLLTAAVLSAAMTATSALADEPCAEVAKPSFPSVEHDAEVQDWVVTAVTLELKGCDGEDVALRLLTDDGGELPIDGPVVTRAESGLATFDLAEVPVAVRPVIGIRVSLLGEGVEVLALEPEPTSEHEADVTPSVLAATGLSGPVALIAGLVLVLLGWRLLRSRRADARPRSTSRR